jgi:hypothetical protein
VSVKMRSHCVCRSADALARIENALPGRETFDIEIYGMVGIPEADLAEWRARRGNQQGQGSGGPSAKRQKVENVALTPEQLKAQLEAHKALMSGKAPPPGAIAGQFHSFAPGLAPPSFGYPPNGPPPGFGNPPGSGYNRPPPMYNRPPPGIAPPSAGPYAGPPPNVYPTGPPPPALYSSGPPPAQFAAGPPPPLIGVPPPRSSPAAVTPQINLPLTNPHQEAVKNGAKSRMVYNDPLMSPEEKLASTSKYLYVDPEGLRQRAIPPPAQYQAPPPTSTMSPNTAQQQYYGPPPGFGGASSPPGTMSSPYAASPHSPYVAQQQQYQQQPPPSLQPPPPPQQQYGAYGGYNPPHLQGPPPSVNYSANPAHSHAQSYPSISSGGKGGIEPASKNPEENTAEALAEANVSVGSGIEREADMAEMQSKVSANQEQGVAQSSGSSEIAEVSSQTSARPGRARAADLF